MQLYVAYYANEHVYHCGSIFIQLLLSYRNQDTVPHNQRQFLLDSSPRLRKLVEYLQNDMCNIKLWNHMQLTMQKKKQIRLWKWIWIYVNLLTTLIRTQISCSCFWTVSKCTILTIITSCWFSWWFWLCKVNKKECTKQKWS